jgi:transcriptional regulator with XRE-family HTH domain
MRTQTTDMAAAKRTDEPSYYAALRRALADNIKAARVERGWTKVELASRSGTAPEYLRRLEAGRVNATIETVCAMAEALGLHPLDLLRLP